MFHQGQIQQLLIHISLHYGVILIIAIIIIAIINIIIIIYKK